MQENLPRVALFEGMWYTGGERSGYNTVARNKGHRLGRKVEKGIWSGTRQTTSEWDIYTNIASVTWHHPASQNGSREEWKDGRMEALGRRNSHLLILLCR